MPKVVQFTDSVEFGGAEQCLLNLISGFDPSIWRVVFMYFPAQGLKPLVDEASRLGVSLRPIPRGKGVKGIKSMILLYRTLREEKPEVFHAHMRWQSACASGILIAAFSRIPAIVATLHLYVDVQLGLPDRIKSMLIHACVDRFITVSGWVSEKICETVGARKRKISIVQNGIPVDLFCCRPDPILLEKFAGSSGQPIILTVARLVKQKGISYLLKAANLVPEAIFLLVGDGPDRSILEAQAEALGLKERVRFLGHREDIPELLSICDLFVLPSLFEGLPLSILEAMAAGKPVVASAIGGVKEIITNGTTGVLVPPQDPYALAVAIRKILADQSFAKNIAAAGQERVGRFFSINTMVKGVLEIYKRSLSSRQKGPGSL